MILKFVIVEVMLPGVSGEVAGAASVDEWTGAVEDVDCQHFDFWCDKRDVPTVLDAQQRELARAVARRTLEADSELTNSTGLYRGSAALFDAAHETRMSDSQRVLAEYLQNIRETDAATDEVIESNVRRSG